MKITPKLIARLAVLAAISIILGKFLKIPLEPWGRISFENLTLILAGYAYGPVAGALAAICADLVGCLVYGYAINPIITLGAAAIGVLAGLFGVRGVLKTPLLWASLVFSHLIGSCIIKTVGIYVFYATPIETLLLRVPIYILTGTLEYIILVGALRSRAMRKIIFDV